MKAAPIIRGRLYSKKIEISNLRKEKKKKKRKEKKQTKEETSNLTVMKLNILTFVALLTPILMKIKRDLIFVKENPQLLTEFQALRFPSSSFNIKNTHKNIFFQN